MSDRDRTRSAAALLAMLCLAGCAERPEPLPAPLPGPDRTGAAQPRIDSRLPQNRGPTGLLSYGTGASGTGALTAQGGGDITLNFAGTDIRTVVNQILGDTLHVNYVIDPNVQGTATLRTTTPLRRDQLLPTLRSLLAGSGAALIEESGLYHIVAANGGGIGTGVGANSGSTAVPLHYASAVELAQVLKPFQPPGGQINADPGSNAIVVSGDPATRASLIDLVHAFDVDALAGQSYALLPTSTGSAQELAQALEKALGAGQGGPRASEIQIAPMARIDSVMVIAHNPALLAQARRLFTLIEAGRRATVRSWTVYYLQNNRSNDVAYVLQQAFTPDHVTAQPTQDHATSNSSFGNSGQSFGSFGQSNMSGGSLSGLGGGSSSTGSQGFGSFGQSGTGNQTGGNGNGNNAGSADSVANNPLLSGMGGGEQNSRTDTIRIIPDKQNNAILVYATANEIGAISAMLHKIDIMPLQVRIDATIAEVTLNDTLKYGTQFFFKSGGVNGILSGATQTLSTGSLATAALNTTFPGFVIGGLSGGGAPFVINALQDITKVQVLSSPQLMVTDNQPASLMVGNLVPYLTGSTTSAVTSDSTITNQVSYQPTGVILQITPRISNGDMVTLDISQQVSAVLAQSSSTSGSTINSPTFSERQVTSRVTIADGQTVGLAGLITDNASRDNSGIPWLKNIPVLGFLAGTQSNSRTRTELLVLITPHVMHSQIEAHNLTEDLRDHLSHAATLPDELNHMPLTGSPDPQHRFLNGIGLRD